MKEQESAGFAHATLERNQRSNMEESDRAGGA